MTDDLVPVRHDQGSHKASLAHPVLEQGQKCNLSAFQPDTIGNIVSDTMRVAYQDGMVDQSPTTAFLVTDLP